MDYWEAVLKMGMEDMLKREKAVKHFIMESGSGRDIRRVRKVEGGFEFVKEKRMKNRKETGDE